MATKDTIDIEKGTDETFDFLCSMCQGQDKNADGEYFCADCWDYYCDTCIKVHDVVPALRKHKVINKAQFKSSSSVNFPALPTEKCRDHGDKTVDMFCRQHDLVGCAACMVVEHSNCQHVFYVPDFIKHNTTAANPEELKEQLDSIDESLAELQIEFNKDNEKLKINKEQSLKQIRKLRIKINQELYELERSTIEELDQGFKSLTDKIEAILRDLQASADNIHSAHNSLKSAGGNIAQMFVSIKLAKEVASLVQKKVDTTKNVVFSTDISFIPDPELQSILKDKQVLGDIRLTENLQSKPTVADLIKQVTNIQPKQQSFKSQPQHSLLQIRGNNEYNAKMKSDGEEVIIICACTLHNVKIHSDREKCHITCACILPDGTVILTDNHNQKLKRLDSSFVNVTDYCDVPNSPRQVCLITKEEVAVSCDLSKLIQFVSVERTMQKTRQINTEFICAGLAYADGRLFVSDCFSTVYVYSVSGDWQQQFSKDNSGKKIFSEIGSIAVSSDYSKIYIADFQKGLIILDRTGHLIGYRHVPELKRASGVCLYKNGSILASRLSSKKVLQFSPDGKMLGEVLKTDKGCLAVCSNQDNTQLIVGLVSTDETEVYKI